jgi:hypothetical protein
VVHMHGGSGAGASVMRKGCGGQGGWAVTGKTAGTYRKKT